MDLLNKVKKLVIYLETQLELYNEKKELRALGLTEEEVEGYIEFYWDTWFEPVNKGRD
jgi:hypothetical protein